MANLLEDLPPRLRAPLRQLSSYTATSLWVLPLIAGAVALALVIVLVRFDPGADLLPFTLDDPAVARAALTTIVGATISATSLVITGTIIALQLATGQYSPRLLRGVLEDRAIQGSLAALVGSVVYALALLSQAGGAQLPRTAIAVGLLVGVAVIGLLVFFVHHIVQRLRLETIIGGLAEATLAAIDATHPPDHQDVSDIDVPPDADSVPALRSGYVQAASLDQLCHAASKHGVHLHVRPRVGDFLVEGTTAAWVWPADTPAADDPDDLAQQVDTALALGVDRTIDGDPAYGLRHLVDIGLRAVSPGINDPTTAVQTIDHATRLLVTLAQRPVTDGVRERDGCRAVLPKPGLAGHLDLAQSQLLQYGGGDVRVVEALSAQLRDVLEAGTRTERTSLVRDHLERLRLDGERRDHHPADRKLLDVALDRVDRLLTDDSPDDEESSAG